MTIIREAMQTIERVMDREAALEFNRTRRARGLHLLRRAKLRLAILERWGRMDIRMSVPLFGSGSRSVSGSRKKGL
jgi:hypothetical protein